MGSVDMAIPETQATHTHKKQISEKEKKTKGFDVRFSLGFKYFKKMVVMSTWEWNEVNASIWRRDPLRSLARTDRSVACPPMIEHDSRRRDLGPLPRRFSNISPV
jgi:hypothetical protein